MSDQANLDTQRALYGETLAVIAGRISASLGLTQGRLASVLGLSAPMLSQLISGHRVKIGNPVVLARLRSLTELADLAPTLDADERARRLTAIQDATVTLTATPSSTDQAVDVLRAAADPDELARLAGLTAAPGLAHLLTLAAHHDG